MKRKSSFLLGAFALAALLADTAVACHGKRFGRHHGGCGVTYTTYTYCAPKPVCGGYYTSYPVATYHTAPTYYSVQPIARPMPTPQVGSPVVPGKPLPLPTKPGQKEEAPPAPIPGGQVNPNPGNPNPGDEAPPAPPINVPQY